MFSMNRLVLGAGPVLILFGGLACQAEERTVGVVLETDLGEIEVRVYPDRAPISANNFPGLGRGRALRGRHVLPRDPPRQHDGAGRD